MANKLSKSRQLLKHFFELVGENVLLGHRRIGFYAEKLCISGRYLFKICKKEIGKKPKILVNEYAIGQIKNALLTTGMSLSEFRQKYR